MTTFQCPHCKALLRVEVIKLDAKPQLTIDPKLSVLKQPSSPDINAAIANLPPLPPKNSAVLRKHKYCPECGRRNDEVVTVATVDQKICPTCLRPRPYPSR